MSDKNFTPYQAQRFSTSEMLRRSRELRKYLDQRRSIRFFADTPVAQEVIENVIMTASSAPSGAHKQPWVFCAISNQEVKKRIREAAEKEEYTNYHGRMSDEWLKDLEPFDTDWQKEFITIAPWLIVLMKKSYDLSTEGQKSKNYYVNESVGIAAGFLINAIHHAGLVTLTHTPSPMNFLQKVLDRPSHEKPFLLLPVGYPAEGALVPNLIRKTADQVIDWYN